MGLRIVDNVVIVDHDVNEHLQTTAIGNPSIDWIDDLQVYAIFQRKFHSAKASRDRQARILGDNCPLIYALKGKDGLTVEFRSIKSLNDSIPTIINAVVDDLGESFDAVVPMPSSSPLSAILAKRLARASGRPLLGGMFSKSTNGVAMASVAGVLAENSRAFPKEDAVHVRNALKFLRSIEDEPYAAKNIKTQIRKYFLPLAINAIPPQLDAGTRLLLVDDLLATGETLRAAQSLLINSGIVGQHVAATWFSRVGKPNR